MGLMSRRGGRTGAARRERNRYFRVRWRHRRARSGRAPRPGRCSAARWSCHAGPGSTRSRSTWPLSPIPGSGRGGGTGSTPGLPADLLQHRLVWAEVGVGAQETAELRVDQHKVGLRLCRPRRRRPAARRASASGRMPRTASTVPVCHSTRSIVVCRQFLAQDRQHGLGGHVAAAPDGELEMRRGPHCLQRAHHLVGKDASGAWNARAGPPAPPESPTVEPDPRARMFKASFFASAAATCGSGRAGVVRSAGISQAAPPSARSGCRTRQRPGRAEGHQAEPAACASTGIRLGIHRQERGGAGRRSRGAFGACPWCDTRPPMRRRPPCRSRRPG